jgi:hypothetical protein
MGQVSLLFERLGKVMVGRSSPVIARELLNFIGAHPDTSHITIQLVKQLTLHELGEDLDKQILLTLQFLAGDEVQVLEPRFELIEQDGHPVELSRDDVAVVIQENVNPLTGEYVENIKECVFLYFSPTPLGLQLAKTVLGGHDAPARK